MPGLYLQLNELLINLLYTFETMRKVSIYTLIAVALTTVGLAVACKGGGTTETPTVAVTGITVSSPTLTLTVGDPAVQLTATVTPADATDKAIVWESSHPEVASVAGGVVTPVAPGEATIKATTVDGGFEGTCTVTVNPAVVALTGIAFANSEVSVHLDGDPVTLALVFTPAEATNKAVTWESDDETVATVEDGVVTAVAEGSTTIRATSVDGGHEAECTVHVIIGVESVAMQPTTLQAVTGEAFRIDHRVRITPENATNKNVTFRSEDETTVTVETRTDGQTWATPHKMGEAKIIVRTEDGGLEGEMLVQVVK